MVLCFFSYRFALLFFLSASSYLLELKVVLWQSCDSDRALEMSACLDGFRLVFQDTVTVRIQESHIHEHWLTVMNFQGHPTQR